VPTCLSPAITGMPASRVFVIAIGTTRLRAVARCSTRRHHLLADIAAFVEIDAGELVHVGFVRKSVAIDEIGAAARHAERNAVRSRRPSASVRLAPELGGGLGRQLRRQYDAGAETRMARIGRSKPYSLSALPARALARRAPATGSSTVTLARSL